MTATIDEQTQWFSEITNTPIVNGFIYLGERNSDPRVATAIFSDRELTTPLSNPQRTDDAGRSVNKIWIPGRYSIEVSNSNDVQRYIQLDAGGSSGAAVINVGNIQGANDITGTGTPTITSYDNLAQFVFLTVQANTGAVTLNVDGVGAKAIKKNHDEDLEEGDFEASQTVIVIYNEVDDIFELTNTAAGSGLLVQSVYFETGVSATGTTTVPDDNTTPQQTEGNEFMTLAITPTDANNILRITVVAVLFHSATPADLLWLGLFQDSTADSIGGSLASYGTNTKGAAFPLRHEMVAGTITTTTFKFRAGSKDAGTTTFGSTLFNDNVLSSILIEEIKV